jgi:hypothetical protein
MITHPLSPAHCYPLIVHPCAKLVCGIASPVSPFGFVGACCMSYSKM